MIKVLKSGLFSTIQDKGRFGYGAFGVPKSGAMDFYSAELANTLLGNTINDAVLEITMIGPQLKFDVEYLLVITGADMSPSINRKTIQNNKVYRIKKFDTLGFDKLKSGLRAYVAVKGGFKSDMVLGSQSYYQPLTLANKLNNGDTLYLNQSEKTFDTFETFSKLKVVDYSSPNIHVFKGPEF